MLSKLKQKYQMMRVKSITGSSDYRLQLSEIPNAVFLHWQKNAMKEFPGIPSDAIFFTRAAEGLMMFFDYVSRSKQSCALPSKAADSVWHAWYEWSSANLDNFCLKHFKRIIPHVEAAQMAEAMDAALATCLITAQKAEGKEPGSATVPHLFALDSKLRMPDGYAYFARTSRIGFYNMNMRGVASGKANYPESFSAAQLLVTGLITAMVYEEMMAKQAKAATSGASCGGSSCGSSSCDAGGGGGCDGGGSGCGSSCGGGCGGGCGGS